MRCQICLEEIARAQTHAHFHDRCLRSFFGSLRINPALDFSRETFFTEKARNFSQGFSISGVQQKLSAKIENQSIVMTQLDGTYIVKPTPEGFKELAANEHLSLNLSRAFGIDTATCALLPFSDGELCLLVKRFDRGESGKIHQEDMAQAMGIANEGKGKYSSSYEQMGIFLGMHTSLAVVKDYFQRVFFNYMIGNGDCHLKNVSIRKLDGVLCLTPNYDLVNTSLYLDPSELALDLLSDDELTPQRKKMGYYSQADFDELGRRIGLNQKTKDSIYKRFTDCEEIFSEMIMNSYLGHEYRERYNKTLEVRLERFFSKC